MRRILMCGISVLALMGAGCAGLLHETHPEYAHQGARDITYGDGALVFDGRHAGPPEGTILASGDSYAVRVDADSRRLIATADARRTAARAGVTEVRAAELTQLWEETRGCRDRGWSLVDCLGGVAALALLSAEDTSYLTAYGNYMGGIGSYGGIVPSAVSDTAAGMGGVGDYETARRVERVEGLVVETRDEVRGLIEAEGAVGGGR